ncbi:hypothetical protein ABB37_09618 [Leptomonas pyrrhocoris]|uniref:PH-like domain-containing protein n=1 Tax=Leptomonas pyrrhocoris TaxID=157538 RepID=A0A0M9FQ79_LEPPY|nr:hypothetical protein ABB37_09618 [Leptomonas pyrrhocoris]KPA73689.1 hypothetical protein ABB37_09618 [Leptomonas pyrrhocoris]|eukprot:XP_015652128.1 hypothetical protein ABB37_09618 [Leptomonas pyrrhocoris]
MSVLEALLNSPTDDIGECPPIQGPSDVQLVSLNLEVILNKCLYCTRLTLPLPLEVLLSIVGDAGEVQPDKVCAGLLHMAEEGTCLDLFCELTSHLLSRKAAALRLQFDVECFFKVLQLFCCSAALKDRLGGGLGKTLLGYMKDFEMHGDDYRVHRSCCSALISLLRGSPANKSRFGPECAVIAVCLENASDFFFQMQCVEVLYRLYKHRASFLTDVQASSSAAGLSPYLLRGIEELPNDSTLLLSIHQLLDNYNRDEHPDRVVAFPVLHMEVDGVAVSRATTIYFSPLLLVVLLTGSSATGGYLTIPYEHVRSVKLSKDHKLELRLYVVPAKLALVMSVEGEGRDKLLVSMTRATMHELRTSVVHQWVGERKRNAPRRVVQRVRPPALVAPHSSPSNSGLAQGTRDPSSSNAGSRPRASSRRATEEEPRGRGGRSQEEGAADDAQGGENGGEENFLSEVHRAASVKAARYREEQQAHVQRAVDAVKGELDDLRRGNARERDQYEASFREDMEVVRRSEAVLKESAAECVQALNGELDDVQALGALLKAEVDRLREKLAKSLGKSEGVEEAFLVRIKQSVDTRMREMEETLFTVASSAAGAGAAASPSPSTSVAGSSLEAVTQYITQQMQTISNAKLAPGELQREVGQPHAVKSRRLD